MTTKMRKKSPLQKFDPSVFEGPKGSYASQGLCSYARFCDGSEAKWMMQQQGRSGKVWIGLCTRHAEEKSGVSLDFLG